MENIIQDFDLHGKETGRVGNTHEELHSMNQASSSINLTNTERKSTLGVSGVPILSTCTPPNSSGDTRDLIDLSSTGTTQPNRTGVESAAPHPLRTSTGSSVSDNVFDTQSDTAVAEDAKRREAASDNVFRVVKGSNEVDGGGFSRNEKAEYKDSAYERMMAEQKRKSEEFRLKG